MQSEHSTTELQPRTFLASRRLGELLWCVGFLLVGSAFVFVVVGGVGGEGMEKGVGNNVLPRSLRERTVCISGSTAGHCQHLLCPGLYSKN